MNCGDAGPCSLCLEFTKIPASVSGCPDAEMIANAIATMRMDFIKQQQRGDSKHLVSHGSIDNCIVDSD